MTTRFAQSEFDGMDEHARVKCLAMRVVEKALIDLSSFNAITRTDAKDWIEQNSDQLFGFAWCMRVSGARASFIREGYYKRIINERKTFEELRKEYTGDKNQ